MYHEFVERKFIIQFEEKYKIDMERMKNLCLREKALFYKNHIELSSLILLKGNFNNLELNEDEMLKFGLIVNFKNKIPKFLHQSYAEYFLAKHAINIILQKQENQELPKLLKDKEFFLVRKFLNNLLLQVRDKMVRIETQQKKHLQRNEINFYGEEMKLIFMVKKLKIVVKKACVLF